MSIEWVGGALVTQCSDCTPTLVIDRPPAIEVDEAYRNLDEANVRPIWITVAIAAVPLALIVFLALALARSMTR